MDGIDKITKTLNEAIQAAEELEGELTTVSFEPSDPSSVETAIAEAKRTVDSRLGNWYGNPLVDELAVGMKTNIEEQIFSKVEEYKMANPSVPAADGDDVSAALGRIKNTIEDLRRTDFQAFDRPIEKLARLLSHDGLSEIVADLTKDLDLDRWLAEGESSNTGMGNAKLTWPDSEEEELGLVILLSMHLAKNSDATLRFAHNFYSNGSKHNAALQNMVSHIFIPFERDFAVFVNKRLGLRKSVKQYSEIEEYPRSIFIVHGHDGEPREAIARFLESLDFEVIILHEQANEGRTIIEKFEDHADVGYAIVLLTPDDYGASVKEKEYKERARQNVILELGYFIGRLGRKRVMALKRGDLEVPSDILGVLYVDFDAAGAWQQALARELQAAKYEIDWNKVMGSNKST